MKRQHGLDSTLLIPLIAARKVPHDRNAALSASIEHLLVSLRHLLSCQPPTERIIDMGVGTGLIENDVNRLRSIDPRLHVSFQPGDQFRIALVAVSCCDVHDVLELKAP